MRAHALTVAATLVAVVAAMVIKDAEAEIIAGALGKHRCPIDIVAAAIAQQPDTAGQRPAPADAGTLGIAKQPTRAGEGIGRTIFSTIIVIAISIEQGTKADRAAKALATPAYAVAVITAVIL